MANEITFDKLPQAVGYLTEQVERIHKIVAALQPQTAIDKHRIVEIDEACQITRKAKPTIYTLARKGLIPAYKRGKKLYFYEDELMQWINDGHKPEQALNHQEQAVEIWLQKCVQCYVEREWHLHQYSQGKFGYLYPLLGVQQGRGQLPRLEHHHRPLRVPR